MKRLLSHPISKQFFTYTVVGGLATVADWSTFYVTSMQLHWVYPVCLLLSFGFGTTIHYFLNKKITFKFDKKQYKKQLTMYFTTVFSSLGLNLVLMSGLIHLLSLTPMPARVITTGLMLVVNFLMHRLTTFNNDLY